MKKQILFFCLLFTTSITASAQVTSVNYMIEYNDDTDHYDCKLIVNSGSATTLPQRIQFNAQYTVVVPTGAQLNIEERYFPLENNQNYDGTIPCMWTVSDNLIAPSNQPQNDFYSIVPNLDPICLYNDLYAGDTLTLFSIQVDIDPCENLVRPFENGVDLISGPPYGPGDFTNGFTLGGISQIYSSNSTILYGTFEIDDPIEMCKGTTSTFYPNTFYGNWTSSNPSVATVNEFTGTITSISGGETTISFTDGETGCLTEFEVTVFDDSVLSIEGDTELCIGETEMIAASEEGTWVSNDPTIATVDNSGLITAVSSGQTQFVFTSMQGCSSISVDFTVLPPSDPSCVVSTEEREEIQLNIFPNPARESIFIETDRIINSISIFNSKLQNVKNVFPINSGEEIQIDIHDLSYGMYTIRFQSADNLFYKKIIKN